MWSSIIIAVLINRKFLVSNGDIDVKVRFSSGSFSLRFHLLLSKQPLLISDFGVSNIDFLHLLHRFFSRLVKANKGASGKYHDDNKDQENHGDLGAGRTKPVQKRKSENTGYSAAAMPVNSVLEQEKEFFNQIPVRDAGAEHLGGTAEQTDEQHGLPYLVADQTDWLVQCGHDGDIEKKRSNQICTPAKHT